MEYIAVIRVIPTCRATIASHVRSEHVKARRSQRQHDFTPTVCDLRISMEEEIVLAVIAGAALGAAATQGLHAQAKLKAYSVGEVELIGALPADYLPTVRKAIEAAHGRA